MPSRTISLSIAPGWVGARFGSKDAGYSVIRRLSVVLLEIDAVGVALLKLECDAPRAVDVNCVAGGVEAMRRRKLKLRTFISSALEARLRASRTITMRLCIRPSIFAVRPFAASSARPLFLKLLITAYMSHIGLQCQYKHYSFGEQSTVLSPADRRSGKYQDRRRCNHRPGCGLAPCPLFSISAETSFDRPNLGPPPEALRTR